MTRWLWLAVLPWLLMYGIDDKRWECVHTSFPRTDLECWPSDAGCFWHKDQCLDHAEALNEAHERRTQDHSCDVLMPDGCHRVIPNDPGSGLIPEESKFISKGHDQVDAMKALTEQGIDTHANIKHPHLVIPNAPGIYNPCQDGGCK